MAPQQRAWIDAGLDLEVSFNLSPRQLWTPRLADRLLGKFRDAGVDPASVQAEITESTAMADPDRTQRTLRELSSWGLRLALDDFGTGYSSLARLKHMPVDVLKIDQEFVRNVDKDVRLAGMVRAMIQVAQSLDMVPLAEGSRPRASTCSSGRTDAVSRRASGSPTRCRPTSSRRAPARSCPDDDLARRARSAWAQQGTATISGAMTERGCATASHGSQEATCGTERR